jgi:2-acylglycerol O-acyltransferase 2
MFCLHPHGVLSLSHAINFATNGTGFFSKFPGIKCLLVTLRQQFKVPFHREYLLGLGVVEVSKESLLNTLTRGPGWSVAIVPGGAQEALDAVNGTMRLTVLRRKGFVRIALRTGASLVPVFAFGENELYKSVKGAKRLMPIRLWQNFLKRMYGIVSPTVMGRGVFNRKCPDPFMIPFRQPVTTVVGPPLELPRLPDPMPSDVDYWHEKYIEKMKELWELSAPTYAPGVELELV